MFIFFFFKQKTAYEMRISDWSSDVCSSDLGSLRRHTDGLPRACGGDGGNLACVGVDRPVVRRALESVRQPADEERQRCAETEVPAEADQRRAHRSEEHTSELQSLMRISYAVFCLKKKKHYIHKLMNTSNYIH